MDKKQLENCLSDEMTKTLRDIEDLGKDLNLAVSHNIDKIRWWDLCPTECYIDLLNVETPKDFIPLFVNESITIPEFTKAIRRGFGGIYIKDFITSKDKLFIISTMSIHPTKHETLHIEFVQYKND